MTKQNQKFYPCYIAQFFLHFEWKVQKFIGKFKKSLIVICYIDDVHAYTSFSGVRVRFLAVLLPLRNNVKGVTFFKGAFLVALKILNAYLVRLKKCKNQRLVRRLKSNFFEKNTTLYIMIIYPCAIHNMWIKRPDLYFSRESNIKFNQWYWSSYWFWSRFIYNAFV